MRFKLVNLKSENVISNRVQLNLQIIKIFLRFKLFNQSLNMSFYESLLITVSMFLTSNVFQLLVTSLLPIEFLLNILSDNPNRNVSRSFLNDLIDNIACLIVKFNKRSQIRIHQKVLCHDLHSHVLQRRDLV